ASALHENWHAFSGHLYVHCRRPGFHQQSHADRSRDGFQGLGGDMTPSKKVIIASGLSKLYREGATELRALSGVDLDVHAGQLTLLMGPSGSGKTTLLSILGCILRATDGRLELLGEDVTSL